MVGLGRFMVGLGRFRSVQVGSGNVDALYEWIISNECHDNLAYNKDIIN